MDADSAVDVYADVEVFQVVEVDEGIDIVVDGDRVVHVAFVGF